MKIISKFLILFVLSVVKPDVYYDLVHQAWTNFKLNYNKSYTEIEERFRFMIFVENLYKINEHNKLYASGEAAFKMGINKYADLLRNEFDMHLKGLNVSLMDKYDNDTLEFITPENLNVPPSFNWIDKGAVTPIKDQGMCGSCWAFSTTGSLEGQHFRSTSKLVSLSEQNLIDCSKRYGNEGCDGGLMVNSYKYIIANKGIDTENGYPYAGSDGYCEFNRKTIGSTEKSYVSLPKGDEQKLLAAVASIGPISVGIDASHDSFMYYEGGIYDEPDCSTDLFYVDHAVLLVGYGTDNHGKDYWLIKNSWGTSWGEKGYMRMIRNNKNPCCIACIASYPLI